MKPSEPNYLREEWVTAHDVAKLLDVSPMSIYRLLDKDEFEYIRVGRTIRILKASVLAWIRQGGSEKQPIIGRKHKLRSVS